MSYTEGEANGFFEAVESLKKYRRADLIDESGRSVLEELYTDLLPNEFILKKALLNNTTFFIGRKGTGKSTIFLRLEQEIRKKEKYITCYLDVKTIYEQSQSQSSRDETIKELIPEEILDKYLIERTFIQNTLVAIKNELDKKYDSLSDRIKKLIGRKTKPEAIKERLDEISERISNNETLERIEIPLLKKVSSRLKMNSQSSTKREFNVGTVDTEVGLSTEGIHGKLSTDSGYKKGSYTTHLEELDNEFSSILLQVFQVRDIISEIKDILGLLSIDHLFILLDDFSEIDDTAIRRFVDVILSPLNNWSDEFIKFKVAAYPGRIHYGKIDPGKIDTVHLDFYNLYSEFDRDKMEENAINFTKRLIESRIKYYTGESPDKFLDTDSQNLNEYYSLFFKTSMNVPRILGYILSYCYQSKIVYGRKINRVDIEAASQKYYTDKILPFFDTTTYSLMNIDEKVSVLQLKDLLDEITNSLIEIRRKISTRELSGATYIASKPYASHFHISTDIEDFLKTLELNFFINKYNDMSDKDGKKSSIYAINYGLATLLNIPWGKPSGTKHRKYFIERPFNFSPLIVKFLESSKKIKCSNSECGKEFSADKLEFLEFNNYKCNSCGSDVLIHSISSAIQEKIESISPEKFLPTPEIKIIQELIKSSEPLYAKEIAGEIDYSGQLIGWRGKKLAEEHGYVKRIREKSYEPYKYELTDKGLEYFK